MQIFPKNNLWNTPVDSLPVHPQSDAWLTLVGTAAKLRCDDQMPVNFLSGPTPLVSVSGMASPDTDAGGWPITATSVIEGGSGPGLPGPANTDSHFIAVDQSGILYEIDGLFGAPGSWVGYSGAKWDLGSNALRTDSYTSADAGGLPILPGLLKYDEVLVEVTHALRFTAPHTQGLGVYLWPARHYASHNPDGPPMGARVRLKASFDTSSFSPRMQVMLAGLKKYGAMLADNGQPWGMQVMSDARWDFTELVTLHNVLGASMEFVDATALMVNADSMATGAGANQILITDGLGRPNAVPLGAGLGVVGGMFTVTGAAPATPPPVTLPPPPTGIATSILGTLVTPQFPRFNENLPITLGLKFRSDVPGFITGIRFLKGSPLNGGTHIGLLYSKDGVLLAQATFTGETPSGWQQVSFSTPVPISANTTYVAAYFAMQGHSIDDPFFASSGIDNAPLHALKFGVDGPNGVFGRGNGPQFPATAYGSANFWVDVLFSGQVK